MKKIDNTMTDKEWFNIYWNYFELMSNQRISMLNFYISIEIVLFGGLFTLLLLNSRMRWAEYLVSIAIVFMSIVFYGIDYRTKMMIHKCEKLMTNLEDKYKPFQFGADPIHYINSVEENGERTPWHKDMVLSILNMSYSKWFNLIFLIIGFIGFALTIMLLLNMIP